MLQEVTSLLGRVVPIAMGPLKSYLDPLNLQ